MGKRRTEHPVENGSFLDDFLEWMDSPECLTENGLSDFSGL
jgi:hypothetical protein